MDLYSIKRAEEVIDEYIPNPKYREIMKLKMCQGLCYETIGEAVGYSPQWVKEVVKKYRHDILSLL